MPASITVKTQHPPKSVLNRGEEVTGTRIVATNTIKNTAQNIKSMQKVKLT